MEADKEDREPTEAELDALIARQRKRLPRWWSKEDPDSVEPGEFHYTGGPGDQSGQRAQQRRRISELLADGLRPGAIAEQLKISRSVVYFVLKNLKGSES